MRSSGYDSRPQRNRCIPSIRVAAGPDSFTRASPTFVTVGGRQHGMSVMRAFSQSGGRRPATRAPRAGSRPRAWRGSGWRSSRRRLTQQLLCLEAGPEIWVRIAVLVCALAPLSLAVRELNAQAALTVPAGLPDWAFNIP